MLRLDNFELIIDPIIIERGIKYFKKGKVCDLVETDEKNYSALVEGSETYHLEASINKLNFITITCDCPYVDGPYCKHQVAVLYTLREKVMGENPLSEPPKRQRKIGQSKKSLPSMKKMIEGFSEHDMKDILLEAISSRIELKALIKKKYLDTREPSEKKSFDLVISSLIKSSTDRYGFVDYWHCNSLVTNIDPFLTDAEDCIETDPEKALSISKSIIENMVPLIEQSDDSSGMLGTCIQHAFEIMFQCINHMNDQSQSNFFHYCLKISDRKVFRDWDYYWELLHLAAILCPEDGKQKLFNILNPYIQDESEEFDARFKLGQSLEVLWTFYKTHGSKKEKEIFLEAYLQEDKVLLFAVEYYFEANNLLKALELAQMGFERKSYIDKELRKLQVKIAKGLGDQEFLKESLLSSVLKDSNIEDFKELKSLVSKKEWPGFFHDLEIKLSGHHFLEDLYHHEKQWDKLLDVLTPYGAYGLESFEKDLKKHVPEKLAKAYVPCVYEMIEKHSAGRSNYQKACKYLRKIIKLGDQEKAEAIKQDLIQKYPRKKALLDELSRL